MNLPRGHEYSVYNFHSDLFLSGLERIIMVSRPSLWSIFLHPARLLSINFISLSDLKLTYGPPVIYPTVRFHRLGEGRQLCITQLCTLRSRGMWRTLAWQGTIYRGRSRGLLVPHLLRCVSLARRTRRRPRRASRLGVTGRQDREIGRTGRRQLLLRRGRRTWMRTGTEERSLLRDYSIHEEKVREG